MLTNMYYCGYYKPFILDNKMKIKRADLLKKVYNSENTHSSSGKKDAAEQPFSFFLNKMIKEDVVKYASNVSSNINGLKDVARFMMSGSNRKRSMDKNNYANGLEDFVESFNKFKDFSDSAQKNSNAMSSFVNQLLDTVDEYNIEISDIGISMDENNHLSFDREVFNSEEGNGYEKKSKYANLFFHEVYNEACDFLSMPMAEHMNFKSLDYYYNYTYSPKDKNAFNMIETGLVIDYLLWICGWL